MDSFLGERLYGAAISCDIYYVAVSEEELSEFEATLADLGQDDDEVSAVLRRFEEGQRADLAAVDSELDALCEGATISPILGDPSSAQTRIPGAPIVAGEEWENDQTEVEIIDAADDFVLLVEEGDLEELETSANDIPGVTVPPPLPGEKRAEAEVEAEVADDDEEDEGFFKKLFGTRRSSNRP